MFVLLVRALLSFLCSILLSKVFFEYASWLKIAFLGLILLGFSYLFEYIRKKNHQDGSP